MKNYFFSLCLGVVCFFNMVLISEDDPKKARVLRFVPGNPSIQSHPSASNSNPEIKFDPSIINEEVVNSAARKITKRIRRVLRAWIVSSRLSTTDRQEVVHDFKKLREQLSGEADSPFALTSLQLGMVVGFLNLGGLEALLPPRKKCTDEEVAAIECFVECLVKDLDYLVRLTLLDTFQLINLVRQREFATFSAALLSKCPNTSKFVETAYGSSEDFFKKCTPACKAYCLELIDDAITAFSEK